MAAARRWRFRRLQHALLDRTRAKNFGGAVVAAVNLVSRAPTPTSYLLRYATGAYQSEEQLGALDQGADQGPNWSLGQVGGDQS